MFDDGYNPIYGETDFTETFYGADTGGIDGAFSEDEVFSVLNGIINEAAQKAREAFNEGLNELRQSDIFNELIFYTAVFALKMALYATLRKGLERNYKNF